MTGQAMIDAAPMTRFLHAYVRCRDAKWANPLAYMRFSVLLHDGQRALGPWAHLFDRTTQAAIGEPTPQAILIGFPPFDVQAFLTQDYDVWAGPLDRDDREAP